MPRGVRSRNGCARCKAQRLKCDETWPECGRCTRLGTRCSGPVLHVRWSNKHEMFDARASRNAKSGDSPGTPAIQDAISPALRDEDENHTNADNTLVVAQHLESLPAVDNSWDWMTQPFELFTPESLTLDNDCSTGPIPHQQLVPESEPPLESEDFSSILDPVSPSDLLFDESDLQPQQENSLLRMQSSYRHESVRHIDRPLNEYGTVLVEYYFRDTARILAVYDSNMNPFRSTVSRSWGYSEIVYYTLQSMAAACLSNVYPQMSVIARKFRRKAVDLFNASDQTYIDEQVLLALFMIGGTASWFDVDDTGVGYFKLLKKHVQQMGSSEKSTCFGDTKSFFQDLVICWEMFLAFIVDNEALEQPLVLDRLPSSKNTSISVFPGLQVPHPLTGVASDAHVLLSRVGRLVRRNRRRVHDQGFTTRAILAELEREISEASEVEAALTELQAPPDTDIINTGDIQTPTWHLSTLAEVYRRVGLLQLYRVFPDVLEARLGAPTFERVGVSINPDGIATGDPDKWLLYFALDTVNLLRSIPADSGTKDFQPFLLVASCSELRLPLEEDTADLSSAAESLAIVNSHIALQIHEAREFAIIRLQNLQCAIPKQPVQRCIDILKATWERMDCFVKDNGSSFPYWMDVMIAKGWDTFMA